MIPQDTLANKEQKETDSDWLNNREIYYLL